MNKFLLQQKTEYIGKRKVFHIKNLANKSISVSSCCFPVLSAENNYVFAFSYMI